MLVLSRKQTQRILLGDEIRITVVAIEGGRVRLGIEAPPEIAILRGELSGRGRDPEPNAICPVGQTIPGGRGR